MTDLLASIPHWSWMAGPTTRSTTVLPTLLAALAAIALVAVLVAAHRRAVPERASARIFVRVIAGLAAGSSLVAIGLLTFFEPRHVGLLPWTLTLIAVGVAAPVAVWRAARGLSWRHALAAAALMAVGQVGALHAARVVAVDWPEIEVVGSVHQHVGLDQHVRGRLRDGGAGWRLTHDDAFVSGERPGTYRVTLQAERGFERVRRVVRVQVGREIGDPRWPLAAGSEWSYRVTEVGGGGASGTETLRIARRNEVAALRSVLLQGMGVQAHVYAFEGRLYVLHRDGEEEPLLGPAVEGGVRLAGLGLRCARFARPGDAIAADALAGDAVAGDVIAVPGPTACHRAAPGEIEILFGHVAQLLTLGASGAPRRSPIRARLISSWRDDAPAWVVPAYKPG